MEKSRTIRYREYDSLAQLPDPLRRLMEAAVAAADTAHAPYSRFRVGSAVLLADGTVVPGSNQENVAYPSGLCAERTALFAAAALHPGVAVEHLCVVARDAEGRLVEASPCGACLQVLSETRRRQPDPVGVTLWLAGGRLRQFDDVDSLLPFSFQQP
ncbi:MAG: cytidine deaminase [bacterium P3]|nr:MAG: cytidine deaminase [bacterium P3]KWW41055.1 MAG: cytidine deaminase [bacterium F083]